VKDDENLLDVDQQAVRLGGGAKKWTLLQIRHGKITAIKFNARVFKFHWPSVLAEIKRL
jgi:hypothetical protein